MENTIITIDVLNNMPNENLFSKENNEYFTKLYAEFLDVFLRAYEEEE